ncbi:MAG: tetratricopeptide repeat protein [Pseudomonadota bacterium]
MNRMLLAVVTSALFAATASADPLAAAPGSPPPSSTAPVALDADLLAIQRAWAHANYEIAAGAARESALEALVARAADFARRNPGRAEPLIWEGIVESSYAGARGGLGALGVAKQAFAHLQAALRIDPRARDGSAYTSLGTLYYKVPGFPLGFGDDDKARAYLEKALEINPAGIDPNFFYAEFLYEQGDYLHALERLERAAHAPDRPNREVADRGRRAEIDALAAKTRAKLRA